MHKARLLAASPILATLLCVGVIGTHATGCRGKQQEAAVERVPRVRLATVSEVVPAVSSRHLVLLEPWRRAELSPRYGGQIAALLVDDQDEVAEGDLLVRMVDADASGSLMSARASRSSAEKRLEDLQNQLRDARNLHESGAGTRREVERLETEVETTQASIRQAAGQVIQSRDRKQANALTAPFAGVITSVKAELGEYASPGAPLLTLAQLDQLALEVPLSESELALFDRGGLRFEVRIRGREVPVELDWIASEADPGTNTFTARLGLANPDKRLRAGETATVIVHGEAGQAVRVVPPTAIRWEGQQAYVLRATSEGSGDEARELLERVDVTVHEDVDGAVAIEGPIQPGDRVVSTGPQTLVDGDRAIAVTSAPAAPSQATPAQPAPEQPTRAAPKPADGKTSDAEPS